MSKVPYSPIVLVDGSSYLYRAFHALPPLTNSQGQPTGAVKGVISMIRRLQQDYPNGLVVVVFDAKGKTFRDDLYSEYKANRPPMPDDLRVQVEPIHHIIEAMGLPLLIVPEVEADDVIGTLAREATEQRIDAVISTGDKDMAQLVSPHVTLVNTMTETVMDEAGVEEKFGIRPQQIVDYLALIGDKVDNIPGVPKCGPKTAVKWLQQYNNLEGVIQHADDIGGKIGEHLRDALEQLPLSQQLATIKVDVELDTPLAALSAQAPDQKRLLELFTAQEFKSWVAELTSGATEPSSADGEGGSGDCVYHTILTEQAFEQWLAKLEQAELIALDTETTSLNYMQARLVGVCLAVDDQEAAYLPLGHDYIGAPEQLDQAKVLQRLQPLLEDPNKLKVGQNLKYDMSVLANHGIHLQGVAHDTMLASYVVNSVSSRHDMDSLAMSYLGRQTIHFEDIAGKGAKQLTFNQIELEKAAEYAAEDAHITWRLHQVLHEKLHAESTLRQLYEQIEIPLVPVLSAIERTGALVDAERLHQQSGELSQRLDTLEQEAYDLAGEQFNLNSTKQLQAIFYDKLNLPVIKKTPKGAPSTAEPVLQELALDYPLPKLILEHRSLSKLKSTYTDKLPGQINPDTGRIHTSYHQAVTATGRLSSSDPNLQNIPIRTPEGRRVRQAFIAPQGYKLVAADYSQIELRIMAHLSQDSGLLNAFAHDLDVHKATAAEVFGVAVDDVNPDQRRSAKAINFGLIYGMSAFGLAKQIGEDRGTAQGYIDRYFERYPGVLDYMNRTRQSAAEKGYVETLFGRRLYLPEINAQNTMRRQAAERTAINAPMQGTAADIIKRAMISVFDWLNDSKLDARMIMQVHDELVLEVAENQLDDTINGLVERMSQAAELSVPLLVEAGVGSNWDEAH